MRLPNEPCVTPSCSALRDLGRAPGMPNSRRQLPESVELGEVPASAGRSRGLGGGQGEGLHEPLLAPDTAPDTALGGTKCAQ